MGCLYALFLLGLGLTAFQQLILNPLGLSWEQFIWGSVGISVWLYLLKEGQEKTLNITLLLITAPIWVPPLAVAWIVLFVVRSPRVRWWMICHHQARNAVRMWLGVIPVILVVVCALLCFEGVSNLNISKLITIPVSLAYLGLLIVFYRKVYFEHPPVSPDWPIFIGAEKELKLEWRLSVIEQTAEWKLWWQKQQDNWCEFKGEIVCWSHWLVSSRKRKRKNSDSCRFFLALGRYPGKAKSKREETLNLTQAGKKNGVE